MKSWYGPRRQRITPELLKKEMKLRQKMWDRLKVDNDPICLGIWEYMYVKNGKLIEPTHIHL